jgi:hypothetical protein
MSCKATLPKLRVSRIKLTSKHAVEVVEYILIGRRIRHVSVSDQFAMMKNAVKELEKRLQDVADRHQALVAKVRLSV